MVPISLLCFGSILWVYSALHLPPSLTCRNERHKILEHEPNISLPRLQFAFSAPDIEKMKIDMQNRSDVHFHAFLICSQRGSRRGWIGIGLGSDFSSRPILLLFDSER